ARSRGGAPPVHQLLPQTADIEQKATKFKAILYNKSYQKWHGARHKKLRKLLLEPSSSPKKLPVLDVVPIGTTTALQMIPIRGSFHRRQFPRSSLPRRLPPPFA